MGETLTIGGETARRASRKWSQRERRIREGQINKFEGGPQMAQMNADGKNQINPSFARLQS